MEKPIILPSQAVKAIMDGRKTTHRIIIPKFKIGDALYVCETWQAQNMDGKWWHDVKRDDRPLYNWAATNPVYPAYLQRPPRWLPSIHMPKMFCRLWLNVLDVRVERLQDIAVDGIRAEGCPPNYDIEACNGVSHAMFGWFENLWDGINAKRGYAWATNPYVWVIVFDPKT